VRHQRPVVWSALTATAVTVMANSNQSTAIMKNAPIRTCLGISGMNGNEEYWGGGISIISQNFPKSPSILFRPLDSSISQTSPYVSITPSSSEVRTTPCPPRKAYKSNYGSLRGRGIVCLFYFLFPQYLICAFLFCFDLQDFFLYLRISSSTT
jgi:hypothetical protein